ncbi:hypothetical protein B0H17DRAFT_1183682 [Mycena rosella]|uniref:Uncharacterized protein n=1 Tax=Mycena rosella TaxID=1033263 RepID=A0AAD7CZ98_MYCRO|nr:hypothetical protein B0H17DRAFT_1183682 [Mycena rosella]
MSRKCRCLRTDAEWVGSAGIVDLVCGFDTAKMRAIAGRYEVDCAILQSLALIRHPVKDLEENPGVFMPCELGCQQSGHEVIEASKILRQEEGESKKRHLINMHVILPHEYKQRARIILKIQVNQNNTGWQSSGSIPLTEKANLWLQQAVELWAPAPALPCCDLASSIRAIPFLISRTRIRLTREMLLRVPNASSRMGLALSDSTAKPNPSAECQLQGGASVVRLNPRLNPSAECQFQDGASIVRLWTRLEPDVVWNGMTMKTGVCLRDRTNIEDWWIIWSLEQGWMDLGLDSTTLHRRISMATKLHCLVSLEGAMNGTLRQWEHDARLASGSVGNRPVTHPIVFGLPLQP